MADRIFFKYPLTAGALLELAKSYGEDARGDDDIAHWINYDNHFDVRQTFYY